MNITDPGFTTVSDFSVNFTITHPAIQELTLVLVPPVGSGLPSVTLCHQPARRHTPPTWMSGANAGDRRLG